MKTIFKACLGMLIALGVSSTVFAAEEGWYVGAQGGYAKLDLGSVPVVSYNHLALGANGGYNFRVAPKFLLGPEVQFNYIGKITNVPKSPDTKAYNYALFAVGTYQLDQQFNLFAQLGGVKEHFSAGNYIFTSDLTAAIGLGASYTVVKNIDVYVKYEHIFGNSLNELNNNNNSALKYNNAWIGVHYYFKT